MTDMDDRTFDEELIGATFTLAADIGWGKTSVVAAARAAGLPLDRARGRFPGKAAVLLAFGRMADQAAVSQGDENGPNRDRLFDATMRRVDVLQAHRAGVLALREYLPIRPLLTLLLGAATLSSMAWLLESADISAQGVVGQLRVHGMNAVWMQTVRAWVNDDSVDLGATMRALDQALDAAVRAEGWLGRGKSDAAPPPFPDPPDASVEAEPLADMAAAGFAASEADLAGDAIAAYGIETRTGEPGPGGLGPPPSSSTVPPQFPPI